MDQNLTTLDISDIDFVENVAHVNNPNITIDAPLQNIEEISDTELQEIMQSAIAKAGVKPKPKDKDKESNSDYMMWG